MAKNKYYKGTLSDFKQYIQNLKNSNSVEDQKRYNDIKNSVVYISEHIGEDLEDSSHCDVGCVYAHGAIITGIAQSDIDEINKKISIIDTSINNIEQKLIWNEL